MQGKKSTSDQQLPDRAGEHNSHQESEGTQPQVETKVTGTDLNNSTSSQQSSSTRQEDSVTQDTSVAEEGGVAWSTGTIPIFRRLV